MSYADFVIHKFKKSRYKQETPVTIHGSFWGRGAFRFLTKKNLIKQNLQNPDGIKKKFNITIVFYKKKFYTLKMLTF